MKRGVAYRKNGASLPLFSFSLMAEFNLQHTKDSHQVSLLLFDEVTNTTDILSRVRDQTLDAAVINPAMVGS